jgi:putative tryptophan/tyrosine transport system substrate-binding protein
MKKAALLSILVVALTLCEARTDAQQTGKIFRVGYLDPSTASSSAVLVEAFRQELSKLGWIEGKNITIEYRFAEQKSDRLPELAADLVRLKVDLIVTFGGPTPLAAKNATSTIPIVMTSSVDPVAEGLIASLARPGGNVTGLSTLAPELNTKRLEILKDAFPNLSRVGILLGSRDSLMTDLFVKELRPAAMALKLKMEEIETQPDAKGLESAFQTAKQKQVGAIMVNPGRRFAAERKRIVELAGKYRLPAIYFSKEYVDEGGLMSYGVDFDDLFRNAAHYVDKILKGTKPADLPVQQATKFEFVINLKAAKQIGLTIPPRVLVLPGNRTEASICMKRGIYFLFEIFANGGYAFRVGVDVPQQPEFAVCLCRRVIFDTSDFTSFLVDSPYRG